MPVILASTLLRFLRDASALLLWGSCVYCAVLVPADLRTLLLSRYRRTHQFAGATLAVAAALLLPVEAAALGDGWASALDPDTIRSLLFDTTIGTAWLVEAALATALVATLVPARWAGLAAFAAAGVLASTTLSGHAAMHEGWLGAAQRLNAVVHLLAGGFWLGALVPLLDTLVLLSTPQHGRAAAVALRRFSTIGHGAVALVILSGIANAALVLGRWPTGASPYLGLLGAKIAAVAIMTGLAILNRYGYVPLVGGRSSHAWRRIRQATLAEIALGLFAVAAVALFGQLDPG